MATRKSSGKKKSGSAKKEESERLPPGPRGLQIEKGARHCKILDVDGETVFRTTNLRDAEHYLDLIEENDRMHRLLDSRGIAPHRIYLLAADEAKRGRVNLERAPANEVVIVARADDAVVVRHLADGREEIVDLDELEPIEGGMYLQAAEAEDQLVYVVLRYDREGEGASVAAFHEKDKATETAKHWSSLEESPGSEYQAPLTASEGDVLVFHAEVSVED